MRPAALVPLLALAATLAPSAARAWPADPAVNQPVCVASGDQGAPRAIAAGSSETIVAWWDGRAGGQIFAQRLDADGQPMWAIDGIALGAPGASGDPWLVTDGAGGAVIVWIEDTGTTRALKAQRLSSGGIAQWTPGGVTLRSRSDQLDTSVSLWLWEMGGVAEDGAGGASLVLQERHEESNAVFPGHYTSQLVFLRFDGSGALASQRTMEADEYFCNFCGDGFYHLDQFSDLQIAPGAGGAAFVAYRVRRIVNHGVVYEAPQIRLADAVTGWATPIATGTGDVRRPRVAADPAGGAYVSWEDEREGEIAIRASRVSATGALAWGAGGVAVCPGGYQVAQEMFADAAGPAIVWLDGRNGEVDVFAQRLDHAGAPRWNPAGVPVCVASSAERTLAVAGTSDGSAAIVWRDVRGATGDLYGRLVSAAGTPLGTANGDPVTSAAGEQDAPAIVPAGANAVVAWRDGRVAGPDVYASRIDAPGPVPVPPSAALALLPVEPNPSAERVVIRFVLPRPAFAVMWIADLRGALVAPIGAGPLPGGQQVVDWDGRDRDGQRVGSGVYFVVLDAEGRRLSRRIVRVH